MYTYHLGLNPLSFFQQAYLQTTLIIFCKPVCVECVCVFSVCYATTSKIKYIYSSTVQRVKRQKCIYMCMYVCMYKCTKFMYIDSSSLTALHLHILLLYLPWSCFNVQGFNFNQIIIFNNI